MEALKRERRPLRNRQTKLISAIDSELAKSELNPDELLINLQLLEENAEQLSNVDGRILSQLIVDNASDEMEDEEVEAITDCERRFKRTKVQVERILARAAGGSDASNSTEKKERSFKLPKVELKKFNGDYKEWLGWWAQYEKIHLDDSLHAADKLQYLAQSMIKGTRAGDLVQRYPQSAENYDKVVEALKERFGNEKVLIQVYVRELLRLIIEYNNQRKINNISKLYDKLETDVRALETLGVTTEMMALFLFPMVESSLPEELLIAWQRSTSFGKCTNYEGTARTELSCLMDFLQQEVRNEEQRQIAKTGFIQNGIKITNGERQPSQKRTKEWSTAAELLAGQPVGCFFCDKSNHNPQDCLKAQQMTRGERFEKIKQRRLCATCFKPNHISKSCKFSVRCLICAGKHYGIMCSRVRSNQPIEALIDSPKPSEKPKIQTSTVNYASMSTEEVLLKTLMVRVIGKRRNKVVRLVFDDGSQKSYISKRVAAETGRETVGEELVRNSLFGGAVTEAKNHRISQIYLQNLIGSEKFRVHLSETEVICGPLSTVPRGPWIEELRMQDIQVNEITATHVDVLIGSDLWGYFITGKKVSLSCGLIAWETRLGWTVSGPLQSSFSPNQPIAMTVTSMFLNNLSVPDLWKLETIGIEDRATRKTKTEREEYVNEQFLRNVRQNESGRYIVALPWKEDILELPDNSQIAKRRLESTTRKLEKQQSLQNYDQILRQWVAEGFIEGVVDEEARVRSHILPHRAVIRVDSETTPVRIVFDASCKNGRNPSLNDCLEVGPNLMELIVAVLIRFRVGRFGVISDIRKAFQMIEVHEEDRNVLRFLWWSSTDKKKIIVYQHKRVVFGLNCSPFLLISVLHHHLKKYTDERQPIANQLVDSFYVDNCVTAVDSSNEYETFRTIATELLAEAKMDLRQWDSNCEPNLHSDETTVLGLRWNKREDVLSFELPLEKPPVTITKRKLLSIIHKVYDPLGFLVPALLLPKMLIQKAWNLKITWDEELPSEIQQPALNWWNQAHCLRDVKIPRFVMKRNYHKRTIQLHGFGDACKVAYAAAVFIRVETEEGVTVNLLQGKSRVAPADKDIDTARMELLASLITARLVNSVKRHLKIDNVDCFYWTDSSTVLAWIRRCDEWGTFVGNRVKEILQTSDVNAWRHIPGVYNPADLPSRGCSPAELVRSMWWRGPDWLARERAFWPNELYEENEEEIAREKRKTPVSLHVMKSVSDLQFKFTSYRKNLRIYSYVLRFTNACRKKTINTGLLQVNEIDETERTIWKAVQRQVKLHTFEQIDGIRVIVDEDGLVRVKTKLIQRDDNYNFRLPILLPGDHEIVTKMIVETHVENCHAGVQVMMGLLREKVWILRGRRVVRELLKKCVTCRRYSSRSCQVIPAPLPKARVTDGRVFGTTGVDLGGPLLLKGGMKTWFVLYTCAVYRCVHLELVDSLSTESFLLSLQRFISRRGRPAIIYSDNGTNFTGAVNLFKNIDWKKVYKQSQTTRIQWRFNPPSAAWWGGWWERLIRTLKDLLREMLGHKKLNFVQLETCLCQVEAIVNERPLTYVTEDKDDLIALTPAMFLRDTQCSEAPEMQVVGLSQENLIRKFKNMEVLKFELRSRFRKEYLSQLVQRGSPAGRNALEVGDVVLIEDDNKKRIDWPLGRIAKMHPGIDGQRRVAEVKTSRGNFTRPIQRIYPLELSDQELSEMQPLKARRISQQSGREPLDIQCDEDGGSEPPNVKRTSQQSGRGPLDIQCDEDGGSEPPNVKRTSQQSGRGPLDIQCDEDGGSEPPNVKRTSQQSGRGPLGIQCDEDGGSEPPKIRPTSEQSGRGPLGMQCHEDDGSEPPKIRPTSQQSRCGPLDTPNTKESGSEPPRVTPIICQSGRGPRDVPTNKEGGSGPPKFTSTIKQRSRGTLEVPLHQDFKTTKSGRLVKAPGRYTES